MDELSWKIINLVAKRGHIGATREDFFTEVRGLVYESLEENLLSLEREDIIKIEWTGPNKFLVQITQKGSNLVKDEYEKRLDIYRKRIEEQASTGGLEKI
jgi:DNA-binding PadR family transcriptional regulator